MNPKYKLLLSPDEMGSEQPTGDDARPHDDQPAEGQTLQDYVRQQTGLKVTEEENSSDAQNLGETDTPVKGLGEDLQSQGKKEGEEKTAAPEGSASRDGKEKKKESEGEETPTAEGEPQKVEEEKSKDPVPYERFEEVNTKYRNLETELQGVKPLAEHQQRIIEYCQANNITDDQFRQALEVQALLNTNPEEALKRLIPIVEAVQGFTGDRLPPDLQKKVDSGAMELQDAREMASLRAKAQFGSTRYDQYQKKTEEQRMQQTQRAMHQAMSTWVESKTKTNPDFKPKKSESDRDGIYEFVTDRYIALVSQRDGRGQYVNPCTTPEQVTALLEKAYSQVSTALAPAKKPKTPPVLRSINGSRGGGAAPAARPEDAKSMSEVVQNAAAGRY